MQELSLYILDIAQNCIRAEATEVTISICENPEEDFFQLIIRDNGRGMSPEILSKVKDPFYTTRTTRKVGLGIPLFSELARLCEGEMEIESQPGVGTVVKSRMRHNHFDRPPLGDIAGTLIGLLLESEGTFFTYEHQFKDRKFGFSSRELREVLGPVPFHHTEVLEWLEAFIQEGEASLYSGGDC